MNRKRLPILIAILVLAAASLACMRSASTKPPTTPPTAQPATSAHGLELKTICTLEGQQVLWLLSNRTSNNETFSYTLDETDSSGGVVRGYETQGFLLTQPGRHAVSVEYGGVEENLSVNETTCAAAAALPADLPLDCAAGQTAVPPEGTPNPDTPRQSCSQGPVTLAYRCIPGTKKMEWTAASAREVSGMLRLDNQLEAHFEIPGGSSAVPILVLPGGRHLIELSLSNADAVRLSSPDGECLR